MRYQFLVMIEIVVCSKESDNILHSLRLARGFSAKPHCSNIGCLIVA